MINADSTNESAQFRIGKKCAFEGQGGTPGGDNDHRVQERGGDAQPLLADQQDSPAPKGPPGAEVTLRTRRLRKFVVRYEEMVPQYLFHKLVWEAIAHQ